MTNVPDGFAELYELASAQCDGRLTPQQAARLEELVLGNADQRRHYIAYMHAHAHIEEAEQESASPAHASPFGLRAAGARVGRGDRDEEGRGTGDGEFAASLFLPSSLLPSPFVSLRSYTGGTVLAYLTVALLLGGGLLAAWGWRPTVEGQALAVQKTQSAVPAAARAEPTIVGRVTAMKDCRWVDPQSAAEIGAAVPIGRTYAISAGSLEITYNNGAKVTLQGPATFLADMTIGGYLSSGGLSVRGDAPQQSANSESPAHKADTIRHPFLCIRVPNPMAPMLLVADRAAEFRVLIEKQQATSVYLARGLVVARVAHDGPLQEKSLPDIGATVTAGENATYRFELFSSASPTPSEAAREAGKTAPLHSAEKKATKRSPDEKQEKGQAPQS